MAKEATVVTQNAGGYYGAQLWNVFPQVIAYEAEAYTGDPEKWWNVDFKERFCPRPFENALFLNCGNGWVERDFIDMGIVSRATAFDYLDELLEQAKAARGSRPIMYFQADCNLVDFEADQFDLIVNVAAMHHVQRLDRMCRTLCKALRADGWFLNYDYIGPSRNQYSWGQWLQVLLANLSLPAHLRRPRIRRPHLATMLRMDPTEAIHSSLIVEFTARYFEIVERHDSGGGVAYEVLSHNPRLSPVDQSELAPHIARLLEMDRSATVAGRVPPLFSYFIGRPIKPRLEDESRLNRWQRDEEARELWAARHGGIYSWSQYIQLRRQQLDGRLHYWVQLRRQKGPLLLQVVPPPVRQVLRRLGITRAAAKRLLRGVRGRG